jgi:3-methyladenine DNA glycosylase/8-oxoguanine DNA glycosylase
MQVSPKAAQLAVARTTAVRHSAAVATTRRFTLPVPEPFELRLALRGHGWIALAPHRYDEQETGGSWQTVLRLGNQAVDCEVSSGARGLRVALTAQRELDAAQLRVARSQLRHMLRLDDDLSAFWSFCDATPRLRWAARRGAGRLLRSATVFEDLVKLLLTTNCTWSLTEAMTRNLVATAGKPAPSGARAFPTAAECDRGEKFFRDEVRVGYRARACAALARRFAEGELKHEHFLDPTLSAPELWQRLLALDGFGPYAAGQAMRLLGHYEQLALDSWCRARLAKLLGRKRPPSDTAVQRQYRSFGPFAGLALWCDLTAEWHGVRAAAPASRAGKHWW